MSSSGVAVYASRSWFTKSHLALGGVVLLRAVWSFVLHGCVVLVLEALAVLVSGSVTRLFGWGPTLLVVILGNTASGIGAISGSLIERSDGWSSALELNLGPLEFLLLGPASRHGQTVGVEMFLVVGRRGSCPYGELATVRRPSLSHRRE